MLRPTDLANHKIQFTITKFHHVYSTCITLTDAIIVYALNEFKPQSHVQLEYKPLTCLSAEHDTPSPIGHDAPCRGSLTTRTS